MKHFVRTDHRGVPFRNMRRPGAEPMSKRMVEEVWDPETLAWQPTPVDGIVRHLASGEFDFDDISAARARQLAPRGFASALT